MLPQTLWHLGSASYRGFSGNGTTDSSQLSPFGSAVDEAIKKHAEQAYPLECCGLVVQGEYVPSKNVSPTPDTQFEIDPKLLQTFANDEIHGVAHSHPNVQPWPSAIDMRQQHLMDIPWAIASVTHDGTNDPQCMDLFWFGDTLPKLPLLNRAFRPGVQDCYALVRDYYFMQGIELGIIPRDEAWWMSHEPSGKKKQNIFVDCLENSGWRVVDKNDVQEGDAFSLPYMSEVMNHCGIILPNDMVLHHMSGKLSEEVPAFPWIRRAMDGGRFYRPVVKG